MRKAGGPGEPDFGFDIQDCHPWPLTVFVCTVGLADFVGRPWQVRCWPLVVLSFFVLPKFDRGQNHSRLVVNPDDVAKAMRRVQRETAGALVA